MTYFVYRNTPLQITKATIRYVPSEKTTLIKFEGDWNAEWRMLILSLALDLIPNYRLHRQEVPSFPFFKAVQQKARQQAKVPEPLQLPELGIKYKFHKLLKMNTSHSEFYRLCSPSCWAV